MRKTDFLSKAFQERKVDIVEPSEEIRDAYIKKSESNMESAKILLKNGKLEEAVTMAYYSMYHMLIALLFRIGIKSENHAASIILIKNIIEIDNSDISEFKKERIDKQYYISFKITSHEVESSIKKAERFNDRILDFISKLTNESINRYREKFMKMFMNKVD